MAGTCIYCRTATTGLEGEVHVFPEAVVANRVVLPSGAVCDGCNNYLGSLDTALATHPMIAFGIQAFALPGKSRRPRANLGRFHQFTDSTSQQLTLLPGAIEKLAVVNGRRYLVLQPPRHAALRRFHRALHHVAFNLLCRVAGVDEALKDLYDPVRRYIRRPLQHEIWPYWHASLGSNPVDIIDIVCLHEPTHVLLRLFNHAFAVDLLRSGSLHAALKNLAPSLNWSEIPAQQ